VQPAEPADRAAADVTPVKSSRGPAEPVGMGTRLPRRWLVPIVALLVAAAATAGGALAWTAMQRRGADMAFDTSVADPALGGVHVRFDQGHRNTHTIAGRFAPFASLLRATAATSWRSRRRSRQTACPDATCS